MTELEIYDIILDIEDLLDKVLEKANSQEINRIAQRYNKYYVEKDFFDIKLLRNAILENKVKNTPFQTLIISKINDLKLPGYYQGIYENFPSSITEQEEYVTNLKGDYEIANKCYKLLLEIEILSETESEIGYEDMKTSEYANFIRYQNNLYINAQSGNQTQEYALTMIKSYFRKLTLEKKRQLYYEYLSLNYNRNIFDYLNLETISVKLATTSNLNYSVVHNSYIRYQYLLLILILNDIYKENTLLEIYNSISAVHNSKDVKELIKKKSKNN